MILYHGSNSEVRQPDLLHSRKNIDFGAGFYMTPIYEQAVKWCGKFKRQSGVGILSRYVFDESALEKCKALRFEDYSEAWLDFVMTCRRGQDSSDYDIVIGGVANDKVFNTVELFFDGLIDKNEAIKRLRYEKPNMQYCFRNDEIMERYLRFEGSETV